MSLDEPENFAEAVDDPERAMAERLRLKATRVGPLYATMMLAAGAVQETLLIFGVTKDAAPLLDQAQAEHYFESGWVLDKDDNETMLIYEVEYISPVPLTISFHFDATKDLGALIGISQLGRFGFTDEEKGSGIWKSGRLIVLDDVATEFSNDVTEAFSHIAKGDT